MSFSHWICAEPNYDGGVVFISVNGSNFTHFQPTVLGGYNNSWYDGMIGGQTLIILLQDMMLLLVKGMVNHKVVGLVRYWYNSSVVGKNAGSLEDYNGSTVQFRFEFAADSIGIMTVGM